MSNTQRYYLACACDEHGMTGNLIGIYSNQKNMLDAITASNISLNGAYIKGTRKNKEVSGGSISMELQNSINCTVYKDDLPFIKILVMFMNETNPIFKGKK